MSPAHPFWGEVSPVVAAELEVATAREELEAVEPLAYVEGSDSPKVALALDRYMHAVIERNAIRDGTP